MLLVPAVTLARKHLIGKEYDINELVEFTELPVENHVAAVEMVDGGSRVYSIA